MKTPVQGLSCPPITWLRAEQKHSRLGSQASKGISMQSTRMWGMAAFATAVMASASAAPVLARGAPAAIDIGAAENVAGQAHMSVTVALKLRNTDQIESLLQSIYTAGSPGYRQFLTSQAICREVRSHRGHHRQSDATFPEGWIASCASHRNPPERLGQRGGDAGGVRRAVACIPGRADGDQCQASSSTRPSVRRRSRPTSPTLCRAWMGSITGRTFGRIYRARRRCRQRQISP